MRILFFSECKGCKSKNPTDSYANLFDDKKCPNATCCKDKKINGCWQCDKVNTCNIGFYSSGENDAKAYALYIKKYGVQKYTQKILKLISKDYIYPKDFKNINDINRILYIFEKGGNP